MVRLIFLMFFLLSIYGCDDVFRHYALGELNINDLEKLLSEEDFDPDTRSDRTGNTLLMLASRDGRVDMINLLLEAGAKTEIRNNQGATALMFAAGSREGTNPVNRLLAVNRLLEDRADFDASDQNDFTPLLYAANVKGSKDIVTRLLEAGADPHVRTHMDSTSLMLAANKGDEDTVAIFLDAGVDVHARNKDDETALIRAAYNRSAGGVIDILLAAGADINARNKWGETPLVVSIGRGNANTATRLLEAGADIHIRDNDHNTPLILTANIGAASIIEMLLQKNADINARNNEGQTPLVMAYIRGHESIVEMLLASGATVAGKTSEQYDDISTILNELDFLINGQQYQTIYWAQCDCYEDDIFVFNDFLGTSKGSSTINSSAAQEDVRVNCPAPPAWSDFFSGADGLVLKRCEYWTEEIEIPMN